MVCARLHIICGNCGNGDGDMFEYEINKDGLDYGDGTFDDAVYIWCKNCGTLHSLDNKMPIRKPKVKELKKGEEE